MSLFSVISYGALISLWQYLFMQVSEKVGKIWETGVQPSLWLTVFGKGDKGLRIQAYDAIKEAVSKACAQ